MTITRIKAGEVRQFRGDAFCYTETRHRWLPFLKSSHLVNLGTAKGGEPQMFPAHRQPTKNEEQALKACEGTSYAEESGVNAFLNKLIANQNLSELEVDVLKQCQSFLTAAWHHLNQEHALDSLRLAARVAPRNIQLKQVPPDDNQN